ncbi:hypothetical protein Nepgr_009441 [Nepenthes gracilis]|uniref:Uncharacterized protein n=1 Tax=Nepenthes gracilis TaxID=150966 RepID=A0AAD3SAW1_NEPGR|nr:hypothetical protein Nepgr_009441 [Nepenthes gracilis]
MLEDWHLSTSTPCFLHSSPAFIEAKVRDMLKPCLSPNSRVAGSIGMLDTCLSADFREAGLLERSTRAQA